jgi:hypothetical protein
MPSSTSCTSTLEASEGHLNTGTSNGTARHPSRPVAMGCSRFEHAVEDASRGLACVSPDLKYWYSRYC